MLRFATKLVNRTPLLALTALAALGCAAEVDDPAEVAASTEALKCGVDIPPELAVPAGNKLAFVFSAEGVQIYDCMAAADGSGAWAFRAPDAELFGKRGRLAGIHYAGPTWEALDGSTVVAARVAGVTVDPTAIPWLLLGATANTGEGRMSEVTFIQRLETTGGLIPTGACTAGAVQEVGYTASYAFYEARGHR